MSEAPVDRVFLGVVDETPECRKAVHFAARRARSTGGGLVLFDVTGLSITYTPVPEPATTALIAGLGMLGVVVWRRRGRNGFDLKETSHSNLGSDS